MNLEELSSLEQETEEDFEEIFEKEKEEVERILQNLESSRLKEN